MKVPDDLTTVVIFREFEGETIAFFPELPGSSDPYTCMSYAHCGQHGAASVRFYHHTLPAHDYNDLMSELGHLGYIPLVRRRWTQAMDRKRMDNRRNMVGA